MVLDFKKYEVVSVKFWLNLTKIEDGVNQYIANIYLLTNLIDNVSFKNVLVSIA